ncbi:hypothetical protein P3L10_013974 [Capsicum annuum]
MNWLSIQFNKLTGSIPFTIFNNSRIEVIAFTGNSLSGYLPNGLCNGIPIVKGLLLSHNKLHGHMPTSLSSCSLLQILSLSYNEFDGPIHSELGSLSKLQRLHLGDNHFTGTFHLMNTSTIASYYNTGNKLIETGEIPKEISNLVELEELDLANNSFSGRLDTEIFNISGNLLFLDFSGNNLAGSIPTKIGNLRGLQRFNLSYNKLTGFVGDHICKLQHLGDIYLDLVVLDLSSNNMVGSLPSVIRNLKAITKMDLSMNKFSNGIPREIGGLKNLAHLSLRHNKLQGAIPDSMSKMVGLEFLNLSHNNIFGIIPKSLEKLQNLKYFNVPVNKLYGEIPSGGPFKILSSQFFIHNEALCGYSRFSVPPCPTSSKHRSNRKKLLVLFLLLAMAVVFVPTTFVLLCIRHRRGKRAPPQAESLSTETRERISYNELLQATDGLSESNLIGCRSFSFVYKGILRSGTAIAVKVFNLQAECDIQEF